MGNNSVKEQIQQILSYIQGRSVNIWKKNIVKNLENRELEYITVGKFLMDLKKKFREGDNETMKVTELKKVE